MAGGLLTSAWVNLVQLAVKLTGFLIALPLALSAAGGWAGTFGARHAAGVSRSARPRGLGALVLPLLAPAFLVSPGLVQKAYGAVDARAVRLGVGLNAIALVAVRDRPRDARHGGAGAASGTRVAGSGAADAPRSRSAAGRGALTLAGIFAAEMSAADAVLFMLSTSFSQDLYRRFCQTSGE